MNSVAEHLADHVMALLPPVIMIWSGTLATIPTGWSLCDGTGGTPDLTDKFIMGAKAANPPGTTGGATGHGHSATIAGHFHDVDPGTGIASGANFFPRLGINNAAGVTNSRKNLPPYYALAYIMKD